MNHNVARLWSWTPLIWEHHRAPPPTRRAALIERLLAPYRLLGTPTEGTLPSAPTSLVVTRTQRQLAAAGGYLPPTETKIKN